MQTRWSNAKQNAFNSGIKLKNPIKSELDPR